MISFQLLTIFSTLFWFYACASPVSNNSTSLNKAVNGSRTGRRLKLDCISAISKFPEDPFRQKLPALFSRHPTDDVYRLPTWQKFQSCGAFVELKPGQSERADWTSVKEMLGLMNEEMYSEKGVENMHEFGANDNIILRLAGGQRPPAKSTVVDSVFLPGPTTYGTS